MTMRIFKIQTVSKDDAEKREKKDEEKLLFQTKQRQKQRNINEIKKKKNIKNKFKNRDKITERKREKSSDTTYEPTVRLRHWDG